MLFSENLIHQLPYIITLSNTLESLNFVKALDSQFQHIPTNLHPKRKQIFKEAVYLLKMERDCIQ